MDVKDLAKNTLYKNGFSGSTKQVKWFWKLVEKEMTDNDRSKMLKFVTSCPRPPLMGFSSLQPLFTVVKMDCSEPDTKLPTSSTCFNYHLRPIWVKNDKNLFGGATETI